MLFRSGRFDMLFEQLEAILLQLLKHLDITQSFHSRAATISVGTGNVPSGSHERNHLITRLAKGFVGRIFNVINRPVGHVFRVFLIWVSVGILFDELDNFELFVAVIAFDESLGVVRNIFFIEFFHQLIGRHGEGPSQARRSIRTIKGDGIFPDSQGTTANDRLEVFFNDHACRAETSKFRVDGMDGIVEVGLVQYRQHALLTLTQPTLDRSELGQSLVGQGQLEPRPRRRGETALHARSQNTKRTASEAVDDLAVLLAAVIVLIREKATLPSVYVL